MSSKGATDLGIQLTTKKSMWNAVGSAAFTKSKEDENNRVIQEEIENSGLFLQKNEHIFSWLVALYKQTDYDVNRYAGSEALIYLSFLK